MVRTRASRSLGLEVFVGGGDAGWRKQRRSFELSSVSIDPSSFPSTFHHRNYNSANYTELIRGDSSSPRTYSLSPRTSRSLARMLVSFLLGMTSTSLLLLPSSVLAYIPGTTLLFYARVSNSQLYHLERILTFSSSCLQRLPSIIPARSHARIPRPCPSSGSKESTMQPSLYNSLLTLAHLHTFLMNGLRKV